MKLHSCWGKAGFTLAEVLMTMTIVGAVAVMTIPTLHYQRVKKEYSAKLKNFYSRMDNAILDMQMDKGSFKNMTLPADSDAAFVWYMNNIDPYFGHQFVSGNKIYFKDGSAIVSFSKGGCIDIVYDVNGEKAPNRAGFDRYRFMFCFSNSYDSAGNCVGGSCYYFGNPDVFFGTYGGGLNNASRQEMIAKCRGGEDDVSGPEWCTKLLQHDQWEFKSDYPHKF